MQSALIHFDRILCAAVAGAVFFASERCAKLPAATSRLREPTTAAQPPMAKPAEISGYTLPPIEPPSGVKPVSSGATMPLGAKSVPALPPAPAIISAPSPSPGSATPSPPTLAKVTTVPENPFLGDNPTVCPTYETPMEPGDAGWITKSPIPQLKGASSERLEQYARYANKHARLFNVIRTGWFFEARDDGHVRLRPLGSTFEQKTSIKVPETAAVASVRSSSSQPAPSPETSNPSLMRTTPPPPMTAPVAEAPSPKKALPISGEQKATASLSKVENHGIRHSTKEPYYTATGKWRFEFSEEESRWITRQPVLSASPAQFRQDHANIEWTTEMASGSSLIDQQWSFAPLPDGRVALVKGGLVPLPRPVLETTKPGRYVDRLPIPSDGMTSVEDLVPVAEVEPIGPQSPEGRTQKKRPRKNPAERPQTVRERTPGAGLRYPDQMQPRPR